MKLAVSTLAWEPGQDPGVQALLRGKGVTGLEVTPFKYWPSAPQVSEAELAEFRMRWMDSGIAIIALQSVFFNMTHHKLFGTSAERQAFESHLIGMTRLAAALGARTVVLGAPKNRLRGDLTFAQATDIAVPVFRRIGAAANEAGVVVGLEPNPHQYGCDFIQTSEEAMALVEIVAQPGFGLHIDAGTIAINDESDAEVLVAARKAVHFHVSEPELVAVGSGSSDHLRLGRILASVPYPNWHSIEMLPVGPDHTLAAIERAIDVVRTAYDWRTTAPRG